MSKPDPARQLIEHLATSLADGTFVRLILSRPVRPKGELVKVFARCVQLKRQPHLSFTFRYSTKDITKNMSLPAGIEWVRNHLGREFRSALLSTTQRDWQFSALESGGYRIVAHQPAITQAPPRDHDQPRKSILDESAHDWLQGLGVIDATGKVRDRMADKHRQINRYLEIFSHLADDCGWRVLGGTGDQPVPSGDPPDGTAESFKNQSSAAFASGFTSMPVGESPPGAGGSPALPELQGAELLIGDMGCGKGYLTFGVWHLFRRIWHIRARVIGVEVRPDLADSSAKLAREIGAEGLEFIPGTIDSAELPRIDGLIALHACNTATDHAILRGIELGAKLILLAPCCHKELRPQMAHPEALAAVLRHGIMEERMAEWITDGLRALSLEWAGYCTKMFEFVSAEHTAKNLMISAVRGRRPFTSASARDHIVQLKSFFKIQSHLLDPLLDETACLNHSPTG
ncbi:MAG: SAM-dependent methyltransferase [Verrucomicrobia bacterium]|nr:SAM-dependent methyltransferase [Verrucomicrobiota bacterium]